MTYLGLVLRIHRAITTQDRLIHQEIKEVRTRFLILVVDLEMDLDRAMMESTRITASCLYLTRSFWHQTSRDRIRGLASQ